jgi:hypothetical protein
VVGADGGDGLARPEPEGGGVVSGDAPDKPSPADVLVRTPLGDLARGRVSARLHWRGVIEHAALPERIAALLTDVVRRTRLKRREKAEVALELVAHFRDGLEAGLSADELAGAFGDPRAAARLIRRATIRKRSMLWKARAYTLRGIGVVFLLLIATYAWSAAHYFTAEPRVAVDFVGRLNQPLAGVPGRDRAWPEYRAAYLDIPIETRHALLLYDHAHPGDPAWAAVAPALATVGAQLDRAAAAAARPALGYEYGRAPDIELSFHTQRWTPEAERGEREEIEAWPADTQDIWMIEVRLEPVAPMRTFARLLALDARRAADVGDADVAAGRVEALLGVAAHADGGTLIEQLVAVSIYALTLDLIATVLDASPSLWSDDHLTRLAHAVAGFRGGDIEPDYTTERWMFYDVMQRTFSDDGAGNGRLVAPGFDGISMLAHNGVAIADQAYPLDLTGPVLARVGADRRSMTARYDEILDEAERVGSRPPFERDLTRLDERFAQLETTEAKLRYLPLTMVIPAVGRLHETFDKAELRRDATLTAIALELHRRRAGAWPDSLDRLSPGLLPTVPIDPYDGRPLRYEVTPDGPRLWSVGPDAADDGGAAAEPRPRGMIRRIGDTPEPADIVLWPPKPHEPVEIPDEEDG